jgi:hypothetical protein
VTPDVACHDADAGVLVCRVRVSACGRRNDGGVGVCLGVPHDADVLVCRVQVFACGQAGASLCRVGSDGGALAKAWAENLAEEYWAEQWAEEWWVRE